MLYKKIFHVILLCKEKPSTRHLERSETKSKDLNYCLVIFLKEILKELEINFLLNLKIKSMTKIFFCNLCIYDTFTFVCNKSLRFPQSTVLKSKIWTIFASDLLLIVYKQNYEISLLHSTSLRFVPFRSKWHIRRITLLSG